MRYFVLSLLLFFSLMLYAEDVDYLHFTADDSMARITLRCKSVFNEENSNCRCFEVSKDKGSWITITCYDTVVISHGETVYFRTCSNGQALSTSENIYSFSIEGRVYCDGNVMSLVDRSCASLTIPSEGCFAYLFHNCTGLLSAPSLPATTLTRFCYNHMFAGCTSLSSAPDLPADRLAAACYMNMFENCKSLTVAPSLNSKYLQDACYMNMFFGCAKLSVAPMLPAKRLCDGCYAGMFAFCTSLNKSPQLPAVSLSSYCYAEMFFGCASLTLPPRLPARKLAECCYANMFTDCEKMCVAPVLPAKKFNSDECYYEMFKGCKSLRYIELKLVDWRESADYESELDDMEEDGCDEYGLFCVRNVKCSTYRWMDAVSDSGVFVCPKKLSQEMGPSRIPDNWVVNTRKCKSEVMTTIKR